MTECKICIEINKIKSKNEKLEVIKLLMNDKIEFELSSLINKDYFMLVGVEDFVDTNYRLEFKKGVAFFLENAKKSKLAQILNIHNTQILNGLDSNQFELLIDKLKLKRIDNKLLHKINMNDDKIEILARKSISIVNFDRLTSRIVKFVACGGKIPLNFLDALLMTRLYSESIGHIVFNVSILKKLVQKKQLDVLKRIVKENNLLVLFAFFDNTLLINNDEDMNEYNEFKKKCISLTKNKDDFFIFRDNIVFNKLWNSEFAHSLKTAREKEFFSKDFEIKSIIQNKKVKRDLTNLIFMKNYVDLKLFCLIVKLKESYPEMDEQLLHPLVNYYNKKENYEYFDVSHIKNYIDLTKDLIPFKKNIKFIASLFISGNQSNMFFDINYSINKIKNEFENRQDIFSSKKIKKIKDGVQLHDYLDMEIKKMKQLNFPLNQEIDFIEEFILGDNLSISVPKTNHDLIMIGSFLKICVGNGLYADKIKTNEIKIFTIKKNHLYYGCIESSEEGIIQMRGYKNKMLSLTNEQIIKVNDISKRLFNKKGESN